MECRVDLGQDDARVPQPRRFARALRPKLGDPGFQQGPRPGLVFNRGRVLPCDRAQCLEADAAVIFQAAPPDLDPAEQGTGDEITDGMEFRVESDDEFPVLGPILAVFEIEAAMGREVILHGDQIGPAAIGNLAHLLGEDEPPGRSGLFPRDLNIRPGPGPRSHGPCPAIRGPIQGVETPGDRSIRGESPETPGGCDQGGVDGFDGAALRRLRAGDEAPEWPGSLLAKCRPLAVRFGDGEHAVFQPDLDPADRELEVTRFGRGHDPAIFPFRKFDRVHGLQIRRIQKSEGR